MAAKTFNVKVTRETIETVYIEILASDKEEAERLALLEAEEDFTKWTIADVETTSEVVEDEEGDEDE